MHSGTNERDHHSEAKGSPCASHTYTQGQTWQLCAVPGWPMRGNHCLQPADAGNGESLWAPPGYGKDWFFLWPPGVLPLPACAHVLSALARTSVPPVQTGEERCVAQPKPPAPSAHCSGVCCHPAAPEGPVRENTGWGGTDISDINGIGVCACMFWRKLHQFQCKHVPALLKDLIHCPLFYCSI